MSVIQHSIDEFPKFPWNHLAQAMTMKGDTMTSRFTPDPTLATAYRITDGKFVLMYVNKTEHIWDVPHILTELMKMQFKDGQKSIQQAFKALMGVME